MCSTNTKKTIETTVKGLLNYAFTPLEYAQKHSKK